MITCAEAVERLWEYLDGRVEIGDREAIEHHLAFCRRCCGEVEFVQELRSVLARAGDEEIPADVRARLNATLKELEPS